MKQYVFIPALIAFALISASATAADAPARPNIILMISDDHRWDALGVAGNKAIHTPVLDHLAREGVYFRQATMHVPQCTPCRAMLLTGLSPHQSGWYSNQTQRAEVRNPDGFKAFPTLPALLQKAGYRTVLVGKWHVTPAPWNCGFSDVRVWMPGGSGPYLDPGLARGRAPKTEIKGHTQEIFANDAIEFLRSDVATGKPFLLWLAFTAPHSPYKPNPDRIEKLYAGKTAADLLPPGFPRDIKSGPWVPYYEAVSHMDEQVGRVLGALEERKLADNTVLVFVGDNGYMMGSRGWNGKVVPYEESIRVPLLVRAPKIAALRGTNEAPVSSLDLPPTLLAIAGAKPPKEWPGRDLTPLLRGEKEHGIHEAICEWADTDNSKFGNLAYRVVRTPTHKLIVWERADKPDELYDLAADPRETKNLIAEPEAHAARDDLRKRLQVWIERTSDPARGWKSK